MATEVISLLGKLELEVLYTVQLVPSNLAKPSLVPIHLLPLPSMARDITLLSGKAELFLLYIVQLTPSNLIKPLQVPIHLFP